MPITDTNDTFKELQIVPPEVALAINEIQNTYGVRVSVLDKAKSLIKFGRNAFVGTAGATIMEFLGSETEETYVSTNAIDRIISDDASFTGDVILEGHTIDGNDLTFVTQRVTLNGQTAVTLATPLARANRLFYVNGSELASGKKIYVYENGATSAGVPSTASSVHVILSEANGQSQKCATSISKEDFWIITLAYGGALRKQGATVDLTLQIRAVGGSWRTVFEISSQSGANFNVSAPPAYIIPPNHDVRFNASSSNADTEVIAGIGGYLARII